MKQYSFVKTLILNVITFNIYGFIFWIKTTKNHNIVAGRYGVDTIRGFFPALLLGIITCDIYTIVWMIKYFKQAVAIAEAKGVSLPVNSSIGLFFLSFVPVYSWYLVCKVNNVIVDGE